MRRRGIVYSEMDGGLYIVRRRGNCSEKGIVYSEKEGEL